MRRYIELRFTLRVCTPLSSWPRGDVLFGQMCRARAEIEGGRAMTEAASAYCAGQPWCVVSDARPHGFLPRPQLPAAVMQGAKKARQAGGNKALGERVWIEEDAIGQPAAHWGASLRSHDDVAQQYLAGGSVSTPATRVWRRLSRLHGGPLDDAAPASMAVVEVSHAVPLVVTVVVDTRLADVGLVSECLALVGLCGYGARGSAGLGKFELAACDQRVPRLVASGESVLALAPVAPQGLPFLPQRSWYRTTVHFGHHGEGVCAAGRTHKTALLLASSGAVLTPEDVRCAAFSRPFIGQALGGNGAISRALPSTIHQGFAPYAVIAQLGIDDSVAEKEEMA
jgi:CRISPR-associated protein Csm4